MTHVAFAAALRRVQFVEVAVRLNDNETLYVRISKSEAKRAAALTTGEIDAMVVDVTGTSNGTLRIG